MPKAILEFNLPEEQNEYILANKGSENFSILWRLDQKLRSIVKHGHKYKSVEDLAKELREDIGDLGYVE